MWGFSRIKIKLKRTTRRDKRFDDKNKNEWREKQKKEEQRNKVWTQNEERQIMREPSTWTCPDDEHSLLITHNVDPSESPKPIGIPMDLLLLPSS